MLESDGGHGDPDISLMRTALEAARRERMPFDAMFDAILTHISERPVESPNEDINRAQSLTALTAPSTRRRCDGDDHRAPAK
jgi:hypothetical protein